MLYGARAADVAGGELFGEGPPSEPPGEKAGGEGVTGSGGIADAVQRNRRGNPRFGLAEHLGAVCTPLHDHERSGVCGPPEKSAGTVIERRLLPVQEDPGSPLQQFGETVSLWEVVVVAEVPEHLGRRLEAAHRLLQLRPRGADMRWQGDQDGAKAGGGPCVSEADEDALFELGVCAVEGREAAFRTEGEARGDGVRFPVPAEVAVADALRFEDPSHPWRQCRQHIHLKALGPRPRRGDERAAAERAAKLVRPDFLTGPRQPGQSCEDEILESLPGDQQLRRFGGHGGRGYPFHDAAPLRLSAVFRSVSRPLSLGFLGAAVLASAAIASAQPAEPGAVLHDAHYHPTDYIQRETALPEFVEMMGDRVGRAALMGIPLQQKWDWFESGDRAPDYYLRSDAPLYYYPFVDAMVAEAVLALPPEQRARFDPMITGFNPTDMYATDHIRRVLRLYPGVFSGIGEFSIHKEVVSPKTLGHTASLRNPALDRILQFAGEVGLLTLIHNDVDVILPHSGERPTHLDAFVEVVRRHPGTTIVWAHAGIGRFVEPTPDYVDLLEELLRDESLNHLHFDLSWDVVAEQIDSPPETLAAWAALVNAWPDRFVLGSDSVVAKDAASYQTALEAWRMLFDRLDPDASHQLRMGNYERLFDAARARVRAWETAQR